MNLNTYLFLGSLAAVPYLILTKEDIFKNKTKTLVNIKSIITQLKNIS